MSTNYATWLTDTVVVSTMTGVDDAGDPAFSAQANVPARVEHHTQTVLDDTGNELVSNHKVATAVAIARDARVWLPGDNTGDNTAARRPLNILSSTRKDGTLTVYETWF